MTKKILIAAANPWSFSLAVERQFARQHSGNRVDLLNMFDLCSRHSPHWRPRDRVIERLNRKIQRFLRPVVTGREITGDIRTDFAAIPPLPERMADLPSYRIGSAAVGLAVLSSIYEITTIQHHNATAADYGPVLEEAWRSAHLSYQVGEAVAKMDYDEVCIFGGRHCYSRPFCDLVEEQARLVRYEQGWVGTAYVMADRSVYDPSMLAELIRSCAFDEQAGVSFYEKRLRRADSTASFFTAGQEVGRIPPELEGKQLVSFFTSSVDEMYGLRETVRFGSFDTQHQAALAVARVCKRLGKALVIRCHPHLMYKHDSWKQEWDFDELRRLGALVLMPDDPADSYALVRASECVFTCGSTVGFEAAYLGVPSAAIGEWMASAMGVSAQLHDEAEIEGFIRSPSAPENALKEALHFGSAHTTGALPLHGLDPGPHPNYARIDGTIVDPIRFVLQKGRDALAALRGGKAENRSGIIDGKVRMPSGERYRAKKVASP